MKYSYLHLKTRKQLIEINIEQKKIIKYLEDRCIELKVQERIIKSLVEDNERLKNKMIMQEDYISRLQVAYYGESIAFMNIFSITNPAERKMV